MALGDFFYSLGDWANGVSKHAKKAYFNGRVDMNINKGQVYINALVPYKIYNSIPQFKIPVNKLASMFSNGVFKYQKIGSDKLDNLPPEITKLLENPNLLQGQNPFLNQYYRQLKVYGNQFIYKSQPSVLSKVPTSLKNISPAMIKPILTGKYFDQVSMEGVISKYEYTENNTVKPFEVKDILWSKIDDLDNPLIGVSPLMGLEFPTSNTELAYQYYNCISGERGALGILSTAPTKDSMGSIPVTDTQMKEMEQQYRDVYGVESGKAKTILTKHNMTYTPMSFQTNQLELQGQIDANGMVILDALGVNRNLFNNSTYENLLNGLISTHNDTIVPDADGFTQALSKFIGVPEGYRLVLDYSHLPYLQTDKAKETQNIKTISDALTELVNAGIVSNEAAQQIMANTLGVTVESLQFKGNKLAKALSTLSPLVANNMLTRFTTNEAREMIGLGKIDGGDVIPSTTPNTGF